MKRAVERGFTLVEVMIVVAIIALLAAIAIPNVLRGRATANESAAVGNVRALISAHEMYRSVNNQYPTTAGWTTAMVNATPPFAPSPFTTMPQTVQGYTFTFTGIDANSYNLTAAPSTVGTTGTRSFYTDQNGVIRHCTGNAADVNDNTIDQVPAAC